KDGNAKNEKFFAFPFSRYALTFIIHHADLKINKINLTFVPRKNVKDMTVGKNKLLLVVGVMGLILTVFVFCWYFFLNRYAILVQEQSQMFLFTRSYLLQYLHQPGGVVALTGTFLTQFFLHPLAGACIYLIVFFAFCYEYRKVSVLLSIFGKSMSVSSIPALFFLPAVAGIQFDIGVELSVVTALAFFRLLTVVTKYRYAPAMICGTVVLCYLVTSGNVVLTVVLFLIFCLQHRQKRHLLQMAVAVAVCLLIPLIFRYLIYPVSIKQAYWQYTVWDDLHINKSIFLKISWLSVIILPFAGLTVKKVRTSTKAVLIADTLMFAAIFFVITITRHPNTEHIMEMMHESGKGNWSKILSISEKTATGPLQCFYLNLALQQTGAMPDKMFHYSQIGVPGLFIDMHDDTHCYVASELFYLLGLPNAIRRCCFESIVGKNYYKGYDVRNIKRLFECAVAAGDSALAGKYRYLLDKTLFYKTGLRGNEHNIPVTAASDVLMEGKTDGIKAILQANPFHRPAFEYLMAYYMLERNYDNAKKCFDTYYAGLEYPSLPVHYAELLVLYKNLNKLDDSFYQEYPVPNNVRERFDMMEVLVPHVFTDAKVRQTMERQFKNTYWFYVAFPLADISHVNNK
ncbi:MAG: DUF6057 family protein, partial [Prevotellaceae bacterium]|nr:DUF6057 family protein [Prevotellaceae bacterium]